MLASPRGLSQLATSFIAYLCQGIHTHALSSLTIKLTLRSKYLTRHPSLVRSSLRIRPFKKTNPIIGSRLCAYTPPHIFCATVLFIYMQLVVARQNIQFSKIVFVKTNPISVKSDKSFQNCLIFTRTQERNFIIRKNEPNFEVSLLLSSAWWAWVDSK